jgi:hypothetical protein
LRRRKRGERRNGTRISSSSSSSFGMRIMKKEYHELMKDAINKID